MKHLLVLFFLGFTVVDGMSKQRELYDKLLKNYNPLVRPVVNDSDAVTVKVGMTLMRIANVDIIKNHIELTAWLSFDWDDSQLTWDLAEFNNITDVKIPPERIWIPDIHAYNQVGEDFDSFHKTKVVVRNNGSCSYIPPGYLTTSCKMIAHNYPYDKQECDVKLGSWAHDGFEIDIHPSGDGDLSSFMKHEEWEVLGLPSKRTATYYACCPEPYVDVTFALKLQRRGDALYSAIRATNWIVFGLIFMSVLLVPSSFFKLILSMLPMFVTAYASIVFNPTSEKHYPSDIATYFSKLFFVTFSVLFTNVLIYHFFFKIGSAPSLLKKALDNCPIPRPKLDLVPSPERRDTLTPHEENYNDLQELTSRQSPASPHVVGDWKYLAMILDKFFFFFWICFIFFFHLFAFPSFDVETPVAV